jgi:hypothetical protein
MTGFETKKNFVGKSCPAAISLHQPNTFLPSELSKPSVTDVVERAETILNQLTNNH